MKPTPPDKPSRPGPRPGARAGARPVRTAPRGPARRAPARPGADAPEVRPRLLDAALACCVGKRLAATAPRELATRPRGAPAMLHYYFGDKDRLREAVIAERLLPAIGGLRESVLAAGEDPADLVGAFVNGIARLVAAHPWLPPLWVREVLSEGGALRGILL